MERLLPVMVLALLGSLCARAEEAPPSAARAKETPRPFIFGMNPGVDDETLTELKSIGVTNIRIGGNWDLVESKRGVYDWSHGGQEEVRLCAKYGIEPFFLVVATPKWALAPEKRDKPWGWPPEPEFYPDARKFYRTLAARYRGKVRYYEFWNEENGYGWHEVNKPEDYAPILKVAYKALKEGDPDCLVAVGGLDGAGWKGYTKYLERLYELGCGDYFDAVAVHPYREDGPIDGHSLKRIHQILVDHGHGDRKLWLTEYGWSNKHGHDNKARWLAESLDMLSSPEYDFVFQASHHTHCDFDGAEYGLCDKNGSPRPAYQVFKDYPKDWDVIIEQRKKPKPEPKVAFKEDFERSSLKWKPFGGGFKIVNAKSVGIKPEHGRRVLACGLKKQHKTGGACLQVATPKGIPIRLSARMLTVFGGGAGGHACVGIDPTGKTDPNAKSVIWSRRLQTYDAWDTTGVGQFEPPLYPKAEKVTLFLKYDCKGKGSAPGVFDEVEFLAREDTFKLPKLERAVKPTRIPTGKLKTIMEVGFEHFRVVDWGIGHDLTLPLFDPANQETFLKPRNDGGDWKPFYWERSPQGRRGDCLEIRLVKPSETIRGCGADLWLNGDNALPPNRDITVSVWTNCTREESDHTNVALGWQPGDFKGVMGGIQEYVEISQRKDETGWKRQAITFRSHPDPKVGDVIGLAFAARTSRKTAFQKDPGPKSQDSPDAVVAVQPTLSAFFDDLTISVANTN